VTPISILAVERALRLYFPKLDIVEENNTHWFKKL
jgi:hypothetical protein